MKLDYIDALRGIAILAVIVVHCSINGSNEYLPSEFLAVAWSGLHGVQLFYMVSAFTLFLSLDGKPMGDRNLWTNFFIRRFFRIAPMYYVGICYYLWQDGLGPRYWLGDADHISAANIVSNILFVHGFNPYWITSLVPGGWSIAIEVLFYCMIPWLFIRIRNTEQAFGFLLLTLLIRPVLHLFFTNFVLISSERLWLEYLFFYLPSQLPVFALGVLLYFIVKDNYRLTIRPGLVLFSCFILLVQFIGSPVGTPVLPNHFLFSCAFVLLFIALSRFEFKAVVNPVVIFIGRISFSMYLVHFAVIDWLARLNMIDFIKPADMFQGILNYSIRLAVVIVITSGISFMTYKLVELPAQRLGRWLIERRYTRDLRVDIKSA